MTLDGYQQRIVDAVRGVDWRDSNFFQQLLEVIPYTELADFVDAHAAIGAGSPRYPLR
jgi:hypothetical protein